MSASLALLLLLMHRKTLWLVFVPNVVSRVSSMSMNLENAVPDFSNWEEAVEFGLFQSMSHSMTEMQALSSLASLEGSPTEQLEAAFSGGTLKELDCDFWSKDVLEDIENTHKLQEQRGGKGRILQESKCGAAFISIGIGEEPTAV
ncbi:predicted protein [Thalassiosira pseudonana CCMP1335]|uniref:Uncharacterized protein n=1 Tax=Thalassiosira pseudonana TaxID=35128 RepID=B8C4U5_THAPS|nr:predicted protein [Thalassiosira pseudonana CCMP1335]EED91388.1 predicted protein [Thalassiosira pseudonana CCMP1335]